MVSIKHKVTLKTKVAQEETPEAIESPKVTLKRKQSEASVVAEPKPAPTPQLGKKSNTGKVIGGLVAAAIIAGIFFFINNKEGEGGNDSNPTEAIAQNTKDQNEGNDTPTAENSNEDASTESKGGSEAPVAKNTDKSPANTTSSANHAKATDNLVAEQPTKQNPATIAEPAQSKPAATQTTKPSSSSTSAPVSGDVEENARRVIRGDFGNGLERRDKLGSSYSEIQGKVNEMYRQNLVH